MNGSGCSTFDSADGSLPDFMHIHSLMQLPSDHGFLHHNLPHVAVPAPATNSSASNLSVGSGVAPVPPPSSTSAPPSRYESQKRRDWNTFGQYLRNHRPPLALSKCSGAHVLEFLRYLDQFGKTKVHLQGCPFFGQPQPPAACACPLRQAWGSLDALIGRLRAAFEENGGKPESNPFGARAVRLFLREVRETQAKARGIAYEKKKRKRPGANAMATGSSSTATSSITTMSYEAGVPSIAASYHLSSSHSHISLSPPPGSLISGADHAYHHHQLQQVHGPSPPALIPSFN